jgi:sugar phosphate isomerase/epimerase
MSVAPLVSLSTCWCSSRHQDGYAMLREMADLGFGYAELSHGIRMSLVPGILQAVAEGWIKISTTHNFCPLPAGIMVPAPNAYQPSSPNKGERELWQRYTLQSLDFAQRVAARVLITHLGSEFFFFFDPSRKIESLGEALDPAARRDDRVYRAELNKLLGKLHQAAPKHYQRVHHGLAALAEKAKAANVKIGCENREGLLELPLDDDMDSFLVRAEPLGICGGWHDVGHARIKELAGVISHADFLAKNHARLLGFHLHDVNAEGKDHQPLGTGTVDWKMVRPYVRPEHIVVLELSPKLETAQVVESKAFLDSWLAGN